ncbi:MAG: deoxyhypusine synthase family protein [Candidatus Nanoarchaeia archaeon]|nr:deoxyhypusine synthase family protein [Candidatus Nanoarchaeia archaeon]
MQKVNDFKWKKGMTVSELVEGYTSIGFQSVEISKSADIILKMKKSGAKTFLTFTANMVTSGLRGFFSQIIKYRIPDVIVTAVGSIEEDIMKSMGEDFMLGQQKPDDIELYEKGMNRVGNLFIKNESYEKFEDKITFMLKKLYEKKKVWAVSEMIHEFGLMLNDEDSILYQASRNNIPIFCPAITDGALGFHLFMFQSEHPDFNVDVVKDFSNSLFSVTHDDKKGLIAVGGGVSKHYALLSCLLNGGIDYAVYITMSKSESGSLSGATTDEAKSWGKIKDDSDASTVVGEATVVFPLIMIKVLETLENEGLLK